MARITVSTGKIGFFGRLIFLIAGLALIFLCVSGLALEFLGEETSAQITSVSFRENYENDQNRELYTTTAYVQYSFEVKDEEYTGTATFQVTSDDKYAETGAHYLTDYDKAFREKWEDRKALPVRYLPMHPQTSNAAELTELNFTGTLLRVLGLLLAPLLIFLAFKPGKKKQKAQPISRPYAAPVYPAPAAPQNYQQPAQAPPRQTAQPIQPAQPAPNFCPNCGARLDPGSKFCTECGNRL